MTCCQTLFSGWESNCLSNPVYPHHSLFLNRRIPPWILNAPKSIFFNFLLFLYNNMYTKDIHTITNALDAAVRLIPTPPAFNDINNTIIFVSSSEISSLNYHILVYQKRHYALHLSNKSKYKNQTFHFHKKST